MNDPYFSAQKIESKFNVSYFDALNVDEYDKFEAIIIISAHRKYKLITRE